MFLIRREGHLVKLTETTYDHILTRLSTSYDLAIMDVSRIHTLENAYAAKYMLMELHRLIRKQLSRLRARGLRAVILTTVRARLEDPASLADMSVFAESEETIESLV